MVAANLDSISSLRRSIEATLGRESQSVSFDAANYNIASTAGPAVLVVTLTLSHAFRSLLTVGLESHLDHECD